MNEKRENKGYKVKDSFYKKAKKRAEKGDGTLANLLENVVIAYSYGMDIVAMKYIPGQYEDDQYDLATVGSEAIVEIAKKKK